MLRLKQKMKNKYFFLFAFLFISSLCVVFFYNKEATINLDGVTADIVVTAEKLTDSFIKDEKKANDTYKNKVIEINGIIKSISLKNNRCTLLLRGNNNGHSVMCDVSIDSEKIVATIVPNKKVTIKGICKGFLQDVIILNCVLINIESDE